jgi:hypothetical protein
MGIMQLKKSVLLTVTLVVVMAILLSVNVFSEQKGAEATPCTKPIPKCCIKKTTEEHHPQQPVTNFILQI